MAKANASSDGWLNILLKSIPFSKLRRYEVANLAFELLAFYFVCQFTRGLTHEAWSIALFGLVFVSGLTCIMWACKQ